MDYTRGRTRHIFFRFTCGDYHKRHIIKELVRTRGSRSVAVRMVKLTAPCCGLADSLSMHIKRILQTYIRQNEKVHLRWLGLCLCALRYRPRLNIGRCRVLVRTRKPPRTPGFFSLDGALAPIGCPYAGWSMPDGGI